MFILSKQNFKTLTLVGAEMPLTTYIVGTAWYLH